ncbi:ISL3 family transposase [Enterococcus faecium]|uniref:ISL3 family transposase n=1 Tax=Enterococcus faecium TaxID=1352 RepID=UPI000EFC9AFA|nr:ISL3 family transposase [Enterococcus faecium]
MSYTHLIKETLDILDLSVTFNENCLTKEKYKGQICHIYRGNLIYTAQECIHCKHQIASDIVRWGTTTVRLLMNDVSEYRTYLELKKQRFKCKACQRTFVADTSVAKKHCFISEKVRWSVVTRLKKNTSMTEIAAQKNLSVSSVYRIMKRFYRPLNPFRTPLPKVLCFDEFKSVRGVSGAMSFIMMDGQTQRLLDIVENRQLPFLKRYFSHFSREIREAVEWIVIDMYAPYVSLVKKLFPKAQLIIDRFHIVQHIGRTFRNHRIKETNQLLKSKEQKETDIVDRLLKGSPALRVGYQLYQDFLYAVKERDYVSFEELLTNNIMLPEGYQTTLRTFQKFLPQIKNALQQSYSNGPLECLNNHIKVLKRNAYGFRSFYGSVAKF